jgi:hypothetical protein
MNRYGVYSRNTEIEIIAERLDTDDYYLKFYRENEVIAVFSFWDAWFIKEKILNNTKKEITF